MSRAKYLFVLFIAVLPALGQVSLGGFGYVPSTTDSLLGQANVTLTADANCTLLTAANCTVVTAQGGTTGAPYTGSLNVSSSVSLTAMRDIIAPLGPGKDYRVCNVTTGGQRIRVIGASGNGYIIYNGQCGLVFTHGVDYYGIGGQLPVSPANGGTGQDLSSSTGFLRYNSGAASTVATIPTSQGGTGQNLSSATGYLQYNGGVAGVIAGVTPGCGGASCPNQFVAGVPLTTTATTSAMTATDTSVTVGDCTKLVAPGVVKLTSTTSAVLSEFIAFTSCSGGVLGGLTRGFYGSTPNAQASGSTLTQIIQSYSASTTSLPYYVQFQNSYTNFNAFTNAGQLFSQGLYKTYFLGGAFFQAPVTPVVRIESTVGDSQNLLYVVNPDSTVSNQIGRLCVKASGPGGFCMAEASSNTSTYCGPSTAMFHFEGETTPHLCIDTSGNWLWGRSKYIGVGDVHLRGATSGYRSDMVPATVTTYTLVHPGAQATAANQVEANDGTGNLSWVMINPANKAAATITAISGGTASCATTCTAQRGRISLSGGTLTTGNIVSVAWTTSFASMPACQVSLNGSASNYGLGTASEGVSGFTVTAAVSVASASLTIDYSCAIP